MGIHGIDAPQGQSLLVAEELDTAGAASETRDAVVHSLNTDGRFDASFVTEADTQSVLPPPSHKGARVGNDAAQVASLLSDGPDFSAGIPELPAAALEGLSASGIPSLGASTLALIEQVSDDMRRANAEMRKEATRATVEEIRGQAQKTREQAVLNLALGITSAAISAGISLGTSLRSASLMNAAGGPSANLSAGQAAILQSQNASIEAQGKALHGAADAVDAVKNFLNASNEAAIKEADARIETLRAHRAALESLDESVKEVIKKALEAQQAVAESMNQTRTRILT